METAFLEKAQELFNRIEAATESLSADIETEQSGNVLTLESETGEQAVLNIHAPTSEVWLASRAGGFRFAYDGVKWVASNGHLDIQTALEQALSYICNEPVLFNQKI
mgnify:FL=1